MVREAEESFKRNTGGESREENFLIAVLISTEATIRIEMNSINWQVMVTSERGVRKRQ